MKKTGAGGFERGVAWAEMRRDRSAAQTGVRAGAARVLAVLGSVGLTIYCTREGGTILAKNNRDTKPTEGQR